MKKIKLTLLCMFFTCLLFAQQNFQDVVYLKNGSVIRGVIVEQVPNVSLKIQTSDKSLFVFQMIEIEKFGKEEISDDSRSEKPSYLPIKKFTSTIELGAFGSMEGGSAGLSFLYAGHYNFNRYIGLGIGSGYVKYVGEDNSIVPIFVDFKVNFIKNRVSPFFNLKGGYSFSEFNFYERLDGVYLSPNLGVNFRRKSNHRETFLKFGYEFFQNQNLIKHYDYYYNRSIYWSGDLETAVITFGFRF